MEETFWAARRFFEMHRGGEAPARADRRHPLGGADVPRPDPVGRRRDRPACRSCSPARRGPSSSTCIPEWGEEPIGISVLVLQPLSEDESVEVAENLLGSADLDAEVRAKIVDAAEGNPLFVEQMLSMLLDDGILERDDRGRWMLIRDVGAITVPPTIQALLSARLDRLGPMDRVVVERGGRDRPGVLPGSGRGPLARTRSAATPARAFGASPDGSWWSRTSRASPARSPTASCTS